MLRHGAIQRSFNLGKAADSAVGVGPRHPSTSGAALPDRTWQPRMVSPMWPSLSICPSIARPSFCGVNVSPNSAWTDSGRSLQDADANRKYDIDKIAAIVDATLQTKPEGMTHWSCRTMAQSQGVSKSTIDNIWQAHQTEASSGEDFQVVARPEVPREND
jgi:hypothetical protein